MTASSTHLEYLEVQVIASTSHILIEPDVKHYLALIKQKEICNVTILSVSEIENSDTSYR